MGTLVIIEGFPLSQTLLEIHVTSVGEQLIELLLICTVGGFHLAVELRRARLDDRDVSDAGGAGTSTKERARPVRADPCWQRRAMYGVRPFWTKPASEVRGASEPREGDNEWVKGGQRRRR